MLDALIGLAVVLSIVVAAVVLDRLLKDFSEDPRSLISGLFGSTPHSISGPTMRSPSTGLTVIDGDTVRSGSATYRLVGFDTPERGDRARCDRERQLAEQAQARLRSLLASGEPTLERVACACRAGTEGSQSCNFGRLCAYLRIGGRDVGETLIREGLAQPFVCGMTSCPPRRPWC